MRFEWSGRMAADDGNRKTGNLPRVEVQGRNQAGNGPCPACVAVQTQGLGPCRRDSQPNAPAGGPD